MNFLIETLPNHERRAFMAASKRCTLAMGEKLLHAGSRTRHAWFPDSGWVSLLTSAARAPPLEVGLVGTEGMLGAELALGVVEVPLDVLVQGDGNALRIEVAPFREQLQHAPTLRRLVNRYLSVRMQQVAGMAPCHRFHPIGARLARWLLMSHDRAGCAEFSVTQEFLSLMLGVRRSSVTLAAVSLHDRGLIRYSRGTMNVLDRAGLESAACACYAIDKAFYTAEMARTRPRSRAAMPARPADPPR